MLPIDALEESFRTALADGPVVVSAPTGSGKSTRIPLWCPGPVLVVEPRRVACRGLAARVAELDGTPLGERIGYVVRDDHRAKPTTEICFVTTGVALQHAARGDLERWGTVVLDEFHERSLDLDLLLALLQGHPRLVVMSATLEGDRIAAHIGGVHLRGEGRAFPVTLRHAQGRAVPEGHHLEDRIVAAVQGAPPGDILVFLPGKSEIRAVVSRLAGLDADVLPLHGGLTLAEQARVFETGRRRRIVCATNVAETSVTIPGITVVIDSGLVRRTRYHHGRAFLTLLPIAADSATQRAGRAGRTAPGTAIRLWGEHAPLESHTPPEIHRESLVPLVLAAAAAGASLDRLPFLDRLRDYAVSDARQTLRELGALENDRLTERGQRLFGLPLDADLGRLLVEAEGSPSLADAIDLVAALHTPRRLFGRRPSDPEDDLRDGGCDAVALVRAVREGEPHRHGLDRAALGDARRTAKRLRAAFGVTEPSAPLDRRALLRIVLAAWPRCAYVARRRKRGVAFANGGTEVRLGDQSAIDAEAVEAVLALDTRGLGRDVRSREILLTAAMPISHRELLAAGRGRDRMARADPVAGSIRCTVERVYAGKVLGAREEVPTGELARQALVQLFLDNRVFKGGAAIARDRWGARALHARLNSLPSLGSLEDWLADRVVELGVESGDDLALLTREDLLPDDLDEPERTRLDRAFPRRLHLGDLVFDVRYELGRRRVVLVKRSGARKVLPSRRLLPAFVGWTVVMEEKGQIRPVR